MYFFSSSHWSLNKKLCTTLSKQRFLSMIVQVSSTMIFAIVVLLLSKSQADAITFDDSEVSTEKLMKFDGKNTKLVDNDLLELQGDSKVRRKRDVVVRFPSRSRLVFDNYLNFPQMTALGTFLPISIQGRIMIQLPNVTLGNLNSARSYEERVSMFDTVENFFSGFGMDGRSCIMRAICERHEYHVMVDGLIGEVLTLLLEFSSPTDIHFSDYEEAQSTGQFTGGCAEKYNCPFSIFTWMDLE